MIVLKREICMRTWTVVAGTFLSIYGLPRDPTTSQMVVTPGYVGNKGLGVTPSDTTLGNGCSRSFYSFVAYNNCRGMCYKPRESLLLPH